VVALVIVATGVWAIRGVIRHGKFDENGWRLRRLVGVLLDQQPADASPQSIARAIEALALAPDTAVDSWGRRFEVWVGRDGRGRFHYSVRSLGADGKLGPCCVGRGLKSDEDNGDWIITDGQLTNRSPRTAW